MRANAAIDSLVPRLVEVVGDHIDRLFPRPKPAADDADAATPDAPGGPASVLALPAAASSTGGERWDLLETCRLDPARSPGRDHVRVSVERVSTTDPDAMPARTATSGKAVLGYHDHYVVDGGKARALLAALVTPADVTENQVMLPLLRRVQFRWDLRTKRVVADSKYGTVENVRALEEAGIRAAMPLRDHDDRQSDYFSARLFSYDAARDQYRCPRGHRLMRYSREPKRQIALYRAEADTCNACPLKAACTPSDHGRTLSRSWHEDLLDRVRAYQGTPAYARAMRKRKAWPEPLFAEAKQWHGLRQFRLHGLEKVNIEGLLIATGQNLKRWLAATGWGRRHAPGGRLPGPAASSGVSPAPA